ncbi:unnamed protein product [Durusdinium trenchii]|uniref:Uncharacterized protein n=1 Tax=Durusdinium trenchii TaxID=1381693 RepID=A0ABP0KUC9_9DINO
MDTSQLRLVCGQRRSALIRAQNLHAQLEDKARQIQEASAEEALEAEQRVLLLTAGRQRAQERSKALKLGVLEASHEVESLRWRVSALQRLQEAEPRGAQNEELLLLRRKRFAVEEEYRTHVMYKAEKRREDTSESLLTVQEALRAFAEGACATFAEQYQAPLMRRLAC